MLHGMSTTLCIHPSLDGPSHVPLYHSLRRENIKVARSQNVMGVKVLRPTWFEDETVARAAAEGTHNTLDPMHGLRPTLKKMLFHSMSSQAFQP